MKHVTAYILILAIFLHLFSGIAVVVSFKINQDYIAEFLCINKDIPESNCNGGCHLKKELNEQQEHQDAIPQSENKNSEIQFFSDQTDAICPAANHNQANLFFPSNNTGILDPGEIFHPPRKQHA